MVQMLDSWTLTTQSVNCFLGLQYIGFQHLWGFFKLQCPTPPHPKNNVWHMYPKVFPSSKTHVVSTLLKWGGEKELQGIFQYRAIFCGDTKKLQIITNIASLIQRLLSNFVTYHWFHHEMTCEKKTQKFHTDAKWLPRSWLCFWLTEANFTHCTTNQKNHPDG